MSLVLGATALAGPKDDPLRPHQWSHDTVRVTQAWQHSTGRGAVVALLDTGIDLRHPDLQRNVVVLPGADITEARCSDDCVLDGPVDRDGHGTATAGIVGATTGNRIGIAGVAPDVRLVPVRISDPAPQSYLVTLAEGIRFAADSGADVIGIWPAYPEVPYPLSSAGVSGEDVIEAQPGAMQQIFDAVEYAWSRGALLVAAAGNGWPAPDLVAPGTSPAGLAKPECGAPALHPLVLCVGAVDRDDQHVYYSDFRPLAPDMYIVGPSGRDVTGGMLPAELSPCAERVVTTALTGAPRACPGTLPAGYTTISGTSAATGYVTGVAALLAAQGRTNLQILEALRSSAVDLGVPGTDPLYGVGRVDALAAVRTPR